MIIARNQDAATWIGETFLQRSRQAKDPAYERMPGVFKSTFSPSLDWGVSIARACRPSVKIAVLSQDLISILCSYLDPVSKEVILAVALFRAVPMPLT